MTHSTITSKGQTTLPAQVREALHLKPGDRISYEVQGDSVVIRAQPSVMELFGSLPVPAEKKDLSFGEVRKQVRSAWAEDAAKKGL